MIKWVHGIGPLMVAILLPVTNISSLFETPGGRLRPETVKAWEEYQRLTEKRIAAELSSKKGFLVQDFLPPAEADRCRKELAAGGAFIYRMETRNEQGRKIDVPEGMVHHWLGSIYLPETRLADLLKWFQDYDRHDRYFEEVEASRLLARNGDLFRIYLRLRRKKIITVHYNTEHAVQYRSHGPGRASSQSQATKIAELENPGTPQEREKPGGEDRGFLWRLNAYWRCQQDGGGVTVTCESISLSRGIPAGLGWLIKGYVESVPRESLVGTLTSIREGMRGHTKL